MQPMAGQFLVTTKDYPLRRTPGSFNLEKIPEQIEGATGGEWRSDRLGRASLCR